jgi:lysylphosphatidylglycerol synthetase-like protein (DUF2156 family)
MRIMEVRPGYELWRPNRESQRNKTTKSLVALVLFVSAGMLAVITLGGWDRLQSTGIGAMTLGWAALYVFFGVMVMNWSRGILPVSAALAMLMAIFALVSFQGWFDRSKDGLSSPALPEDLLGTLTLLVVFVQIGLIAIAMYAFGQEWHVEEERPIAGGPADTSATPGPPEPGDPIPNPA